MVAPRRNADILTCPPVSRECAINHNEFHENNRTNSTGTCVRWRRNGATKTWKSAKNAHRFYVPVKHGLYDYGRIEHDETTYENPFSGGPQTYVSGNADQLHCACQCPYTHPEMLS